jgi:hypothetical protein
VVLEKIAEVTEFTKILMIANNEPIQEGPAKGQMIDQLQFNEILEEYYHLHG